MMKLDYLCWVHDSPNVTEMKRIEPVCWYFQQCIWNIIRTFLRICTLDTACNTILQSAAEKTIFAPVDWTAFNALSASTQVSCFPEQEVNMPYFKNNLTQFSYFVLEYFAHLFNFAFIRRYNLNHH